jgi:hypothetical protein
MCMTNARIDDLRASDGAAYSCWEYFLILILNIYMN